MSEETQAVLSDSPETQVVENVGGPKIPGTFSNAKAPNMQGVPQQAEAPATAALDIEALSKALNKSESKAEAPAATELAETGNPAIDAGISMLKQVTGLSDADMVRALGKAVEYGGDPNLIDTAYIKERFGKHAAYAEMLAKAYLEDQVGAAQKAVNSAYKMAGSKANWDSAAQVFAAKAPEHLRKAARALADSGDIPGSAQLVLETCRSMGMIAQVNPKLQGNPGTAGALTAKAFSQEYSKLRKEAGNRSLESQAFNGRYQELLARRTAGKRAGI